MSRAEFNQAIPNRSEFLDEAGNLSDLFSQMPNADRVEYERLGHIQTEAAFVNRLLKVVMLTGKTTSGNPRMPQVLGEVRVAEFRASSRFGSAMRLELQGTDKVLDVGHIPVRLFEWPIFVSIPIYQGLHWEARRNPDGTNRRTLVFGVCWKQKSHVKWMNKNNVALLTPNEFNKIFGGTEPNASSGFERKGNPSRPATSGE